MAQDSTGTKQVLILAAGELFAERGLDGTSVRAIAEKAGVNLAAVNYHFGSKENLFTEALLFVVTRDEDMSAEGFLERARQLTQPREFVELIADLVRSRFDTYLAPGEPLWHGRLVMRCLIESSDALQSVLHERLQPDRDALKAIFRLANPRLSDTGAELLTYTFLGEVSFYVFARTPILMAMGREHYGREFLDSAARHVARLISRALDLPEFDDTEDKTNLCVAHAGTATSAHES